MFAIYITGTAGAGKTLLAKTLTEWYNAKGSYAVAVNLDPGVENLPYEPAVDVREMVNVGDLMEAYRLGPNGALILASDLLAARLPEIQAAIDEVNPDYAVIDTPGQVELFAYRESGPYIVKNLRCDNHTTLFLFDAALCTEPTNFVSVALLAASLQLRLDTPLVPVLSKRDLVGEEGWRRILRWASEVAALEEALRSQARETHYLLSSRVLRSLVRTGFAYELLPVSSMTLEGFTELSATITRILRGGEEVDD